MSGQISKPHKKSREAKPKIEEVALNHLNEDDFKNLFNLLDFLKNIKLNARWHAPNSWSINHKGKKIGYIQLSEDRSWRIMHNSLLYEEYDKHVDDELKVFVWNNIASPMCAQNCNGLESLTVMGKQFDGVCNCWPFRIINADGATLEYIKRIIEIRKNIIAINL